MQRLADTYRDIQRQTETYIYRDIHIPAEADRYRDRQRQTYADSYRQRQTEPDRYIQIHDYTYTHADKLTETDGDSDGWREFQTETYTYSDGDIIIQSRRHTVADTCRYMGIHRHRDKDDGRQLQTQTVA